MMAKAAEKVYRSRISPGMVRVYLRLPAAIEGDSWRDGKCHDDMEEEK